MNAETANRGCLYCLVSGRVQGVFFRASARERAQTLGLVGSARNLPDGRVEVLACGASEDLEEFLRWLWHGPPNARVDHVDYEKQAYQAMMDFQII